MRTFQYLPYFQEQGWDVEVQPFLTDDYVTSLYAGESVTSHVWKAYAKRLRASLSVSEFDLVWIEKEALPWLPWGLERWLFRKAKRVVVDYDDAMFHRYDIHPQRIVRMLLGSKIDNVMAAADAVIVGNEYLAARAHSAGAKRIEWVPTVIDADRYPFLGSVRPPNDMPVIGWIGSPDTVRFIVPIFEVLKDIAASHRVKFVAIGARQDQLEGSPFVAVPWSQDEEVVRLSGFDIGIMPLQDTPWQRGKCGYKLIQYMACGLPVVASPVGVNTKLVEHGRNGFLASNAEEWIAALLRLLNAPSLRTSMGEEGRRMAMHTYTLQRQAPRLAGILADITGSEPVK